LLKQKLRLVEAMLERARQRYDGRGWATSQLEIAGMLTDLARTDLESKDTEGAEPSLNEALRLLSELSRSAHVVSEDELKARYQKSLREVEALRKAFAEVVAEKGEKARSALDTADNDRLIEKARYLAQTGHYDKAAELLETAHEHTAIALSKLRAKETLEHRLVFEGPADEYRYERDRYESSVMLVRLMIAERKPPPKALRQVERHVDLARALDGEASQHASLGDYETAIRKQEAAGRELNNALRKIGVFVP
jgi:tetratricopeptide (TPR) repeat protein